MLLEASAAPTKEPAAAAAGPKPADAAAAAADAGKEKPAEPAKSEGKDGDAAKPAPADAKPDGDKPKDGAAAPDAKEALASAPPAPRSYDAFAVPEGIKLDDQQVKDFTAILENGELSHQERGQKLVDLYVTEVQRVHQAVSQQQHDAFKTLNDAWKEQVRADPDIGGNRLETSLGVAKATIDAYAGSSEQRAELNNFLRYSGGGNNPAVIRLLHNIGLALNVIEDGAVPANPPRPGSGKSRAEKWYGANGQGA